MTCAAKLHQVESRLATGKLSSLATSVEWHDSLSSRGPGPQSHEFCRFTKFMRVQTVDGKAIRPSSHRPIVIYALIDPRDMTARYVGRTRKLRSRLKQHWSSPVNQEMAQWRDDLAKSGMRFRIAPITVVTANMASHAEAYWIAFYRSLGTLYNVSAGTSKSAKRDAWGYDVE